MRQAECVCKTRSAGTTQSRRSRKDPPQSFRREPGPADTPQVDFWPAELGEHTAAVKVASHDAVTAGPRTLPRGQWPPAVTGHCAPCSPPNSLAQAPLQTAAGSAMVGLTLGTGTEHGPKAGHRWGQPGPLSDLIFRVPLRGRCYHVAEKETEGQLHK